jgi:hypothetical protein
LAQARPVSIARSLSLGRIGQAERLDGLFVVDDRDKSTD